MFQVSIMQIASDKTVFIFDLIKLFEDIPDILDNCLSRILQSPRILKLGMIYTNKLIWVALLFFHHYTSP
jgi:hypothetical protein